MGRIRTCKDCLDQCSAMQEEHVVILACKEAVWPKRGRVPKKKDRGNSIGKVGQETTIDKP